MQYRTSTGRTRWLIGGILGLAIVVLFVLLITSTQTGSDTPEFVDEPIAFGGVEDTYPVTLQQGGCDVIEPDQVSDLNPVERRQVDPSASTTVAFASVTEVEMPADELAARPYSIVVAAEASEQDLSITLACGVITATPSTGNFVLGLTSDRSGELAGVAVLTPLGEERTRVEVYLILGEDGDTVGQEGLIDESQDVRNDDSDIPEEPGSSDL